METISDFEDLLSLLNAHQAKYLIVGGMAFIYHVKPRLTKDLDLWVAPGEGNVSKVNAALIEFPSPHLLDPGNPREILQIGVAPNRVDILQALEDANFDDAWNLKIVDQYGSIATNWIDAQTLYEIKSKIDHPRHQQDAKDLKKVLEEMKP